MDQRLAKRLEVAKTLLAEAASQLDEAADLDRYRKHVLRDELEPALDCLESLRDSSPVSPDFWWNLKKAAEVLGLDARYDALRSKRREAMRALSD